MILWSLSKPRCYNLHRNPNPASVAGGNTTVLRFLFPQPRSQRTRSYQNKGDSYYKRNFQSWTKHEQQLESTAVLEDDIQATTSTALVEDSNSYNIRNGATEASWEPPLPQKFPSEESHALGPPVSFPEGTSLRIHYGSQSKHSIRRQQALYRNRYAQGSLVRFVEKIHFGAKPSLRPRSAGLIKHIGRLNVKSGRTTLNDIEIWVQRLRVIQIEETSGQSGNPNEYVKLPRYSQRQNDWSIFMLLMLKHKSQHQTNPERALALLRNTLAQPFWKPKYHLMKDVAFYLIHLFLDSAAQREPNVVGKLYWTFCALLHTCPPEGRILNTRFGRRTFCLLIKHSTEEQLNSMLQALKKPDLSMPAYEIVHIIDGLLHRKRNEAALNIFRVFKWTNVDVISTDQVRRTCIRLLLKSSTEESQSDLILQTMKTLNISMSINHILDTVHQLIDQGRIQESLDLLHEFGQRYPEHISSDPFQVTCVLLLRLRPELWNWYQIHQNILGQILKTGTKPNIHFINVILFAAFEAKDYQTAWQMYNIAKENGLQPTEHTYSIVVNGAKHEGNGKELEAAIQGAREDGLFFTSEHVACDIMHATFLYEFRRSGRPFDLLLPVYNMVFTYPLLIELGMLPADYEPSEVPEYGHISRPPVPLLEPSPRAITHMIYAYLIQSRGKPSKALRLYDAYTSMVAANHPTIAPLIETPHVSSAFVKAIGHHLETLSFCTTIVENMISPPADWPTVEHPPALPNVVTWSTLLAAFLFKGQKAAAHKVLEMMQDRSIKPDRITWTSMISGYATLPDVEAAVGAVVKMEEEGWSIDEYTLKALGRVVDKQKLMRELKKATGRDVRDLTEEVGVDVGVEQD